MKKIKKYNGRKILAKIDTGDVATSFEETFNIVRSLEDFKNDVENEMYTSVELLQDNLTLYKCELKHTSDLSELVNIRERWAKGIYKYDKFLTKEEIIDYLKKDYLVAVAGLQEIDLQEAKNLL